MVNHSFIHTFSVKAHFTHAIPQVFYNYSMQVKMILVLLFGLGLINVLAAVNHTSLVFGLLTKDFLADAPLRYDFFVHAAVQVIEFLALP